MQGQLLMMPSSSQVLDHQLIFHIMYGLGQFHHRQNKEEERRGEFQQKNQQLLSKHRVAADGKGQDNKSWASLGRFDKKSNSCLANIEQVNTQGCIVMHSTKDLTHWKNSNQQYQQQDSSSINSRTTIVNKITQTEMNIFLL